jgi:hypothetical protein
LKALVECGIAPAPRCFLAAVGAEQTEIEASFREAIRTAKQQKSISLAMRAEAEYCSRKGER